ncbi:DUF6759 domain-containing protein [Riemerella columbina]|uniref:DUF6759 domain-containing protein n=1 Tax=Riemerella columbina TaxID=103810 RepID=UPI00266F319E|nr:DUF6759 domain-containing protein [Riemerella columbina]WKS94776.1 hypothetical protein NYR17_07545 [Riemerella columbina]
MKRKFFLPLVMMILVGCGTQDNNVNAILESQSITEIENYIQKTSLSDPNRFLLKQKLAVLKSKEWMKQKSVVMVYPKPVFNMTLKNNSLVVSDEEFKKLMTEYEAKHSQRTLSLLNQLFDSDPTNSQTIVLVKNNSGCNLVMKLQGKGLYQLPVPAQGENSIVIEKGDYEFSGVLCGAVYASKKNVHKNMIISLTAPTSIQN